jgi:hypothetical protein
MTERYRRAEGLLAAEVDQDVLFFDATRGTYFATSGVGATLWHELAEPRDLQELCATVVDQYQVEPDECAQDVAAFVTRLLDAGLLMTVQRSH